MHETGRGDKGQHGSMARKSQVSTRAVQPEERSREAHSWPSRSRPVLAGARACAHAHAAARLTSATRFLICFTRASTSAWVLPSPTIVMCSLLTDTCGRRAAASRLNNLALSNRRQRHEQLGSRQTAGGVHGWLVIQACHACAAGDQGMRAGASCRRSGKLGDGRKPGSPAHLGCQAQDAVVRLVQADAQLVLHQLAACVWAEVAKVERVGLEWKRG